VRRVCDFLGKCDKPAVMIFHGLDYDYNYCAEHYDRMIEYFRKGAEANHRHSLEILRLNKEHA
jgi:hypothetical protein